MSKSNKTVSGDLQVQRELFVTWKQIAKKINQQPTKDGAFALLMAILESSFCDPTPSKEVAKYRASDDDNNWETILTAHPNNRFKAKAAELAKHATQLRSIESACNVAQAARFEAESAQLTTTSTVLSGMHYNELFFIGNLADVTYIGHGASCFTHQQHVQLFTLLAEKYGELVKFATTSTVPYLKRNRKNLPMNLKPEFDRVQNYPIRMQPVSFDAIFFNMVPVKAHGEEPIYVSNHQDTFWIDAYKSVLPECLLCTCRELSELCWHNVNDSIDFANGSHDLKVLSAQATLYNANKNSRDNIPEDNLMSKTWLNFPALSDEGDKKFISTCLPQFGTVVDILDSMSISGKVPKASHAAFLRDLYLQRTSDLFNKCDTHLSQDGAYKDKWPILKLLFEWIDVTTNISASEFPIDDQINAQIDKLLKALYDDKNIDASLKKLSIAFNIFGALAAYHRKKLPLRSVLFKTLQQRLRYAVRDNFVASAIVNHDQVKVLLTKERVLPKHYTILNYPRSAWHRLWAMIVGFVMGFRKYPQSAQQVLIKHYQVPRLVHFQVGLDEFVDGREETLPEYPTGVLMSMIAGDPSTDSEVTTINNAADHYRKAAGLTEVSLSQSSVTYRDLCDYVRDRALATPEAESNPLTAMTRLEDRANFLEKDLRAMSVLFDLLTVAIEHYKAHGDDKSKVINLAAARATLRIQAKAKFDAVANDPETTTAPLVDGKGNLPKWCSVVTAHRNKLHLPFFVTNTAAKIKREHTHRLATAKSA